MPRDDASNAPDVVTALDVSDTPATTATLHERGFQPSPQQLRYLVCAADANNHGFEAIAKAARINRVTAWRWRQDTAFTEWFQREVLRAFGMKYALALDKAADLAMAGSPEHLKLLMVKMGDLRHGNDDGHSSGGQQIAVHINVPRPELAARELPRLDTIDVAPRPTLPPVTSDQEH